MCNEKSQRAIVVTGKPATRQRIFDCSKKISSIMNWVCQRFNELSAEELYKILQLRIEVFSVEQNCIYQDCDDKDQQAYHFMGWDEKKLIAYTRIIPAGEMYTNASIGRVVTSPSVRGRQIGRQLMQNSISKLYDLFGKVPITIGAQLYLKRFYESFGFVQCSDTYPEDGIDHIKMELLI